MARRYRPRKEFKFWLYHDIEEQVRLMEYVKYLNKTRQFATVVRNGLRLMWTLGEGDFSVLFELFPGMKAQFQPRNDELIEEFRALLKEQPVMMMAPSGAPALTAGPGSTGFGNKKMPEIAFPTFDDADQDTVVINRDPNAKGKASANFLDAVLNVQQGRAK